MSNFNFLTSTEIAANCPEVYGKPDSRVSKKYVHIPTSQVIDDLATMGWGVVKAQSRKSRKGSTTGHHTVTFRNPDISIDRNGDIVYPQIVMSNAHNGLGAFRFMAGLFRMVCSNGLVIAEESFANMKIRHINYTYEEVTKVINKLVEALPLTVESMNKMAETKMSQQEMINFAKDAVKSRFTEKQLKNIQINYQELIEPTRREDADRSVWSVFNLIQEKIIHGRFNYVIEDSTRKARPITDFKKDTKVNKELFELAIEYAQ